MTISRRGPAIARTVSKVLPMASDDKRLAKATAEMTSIAMLTPMVVGARLTQFWLHAASPRPRDRKEAERMVSEKVQAMGESVVAMNVAATNAMIAASLALMTGATRNVDDADAILHAGLLPYSNRVRANRRRLVR